MKTTRSIILIASVVAVAGCIALIQARAIPLGVPHEWEWLRVRFAPAALDLALASVGVAAFVLFAAVGLAALAGAPSRRRERVWVGLLFVASMGAQVAAQSGGPVGHGSMKVATLAIHGSSGYFEIARSPRMSDPWRFWAEYPDWIQRQDALHVGTHPPGLFLMSRAMLGLTRSSTAIARFVNSIAPSSVDIGFRTLVFDPVPWTLADRSAVTLLAFLTLVACSATVLPLYALARTSLKPEGAWMTAVLWPLSTSAILFQPTADTAFPLLALTSLALISHGGIIRAALAGCVLAIGMQFTLAYLPVGLVVAIVLITRNDMSFLTRMTHLAATGVGFFLPTLLIWGLTGANPFQIWWFNQKNHARFYEESPRTYIAWIFVNPIEFAIAMSLPSAIWAAVGFAKFRPPAVCWATLFVLVVLNFSGKNLSEVARLWLALMPPLLVAAGVALEKLRAGPRTLAALLGAVSVQTLWIQSLIQVVSPTN